MSALPMPLLQLLAEDNRRNSKSFMHSSSCTQTFFIFFARNVSSQEELKKYAGFESQADIATILLSRLSAIRSAALTAPTTLQRFLSPLTSSYFATSGKPRLPEWHTPLIITWALSFNKCIRKFTEVRGLLTQHLQLK